MTANNRYRGIHEFASRTPFSRRGFLYCLAGLAALPSAPAGAVDAALQSRRYRADAVVTVLSIPIVTKSGVGSGFAEMEETGPDNQRKLSLRFAAGSLPDKAAGLNRMGYIQEEIIRRGNEPAKAGYFGFMTSSDEHDLDEARQAMKQGQDTSSLPYSVIAGSAEPGGYRAFKTRFYPDGSYTWADWNGLLAQARHVAASSTGQAPARDLDDNGTVPAPMLCTLVEAMRHDEENLERLFVWGDQEYVLKVRKDRDEKMGARLADRNLTDRPADVVRLTGKASNRHTGKGSKFRLWYDAGGESILPLRIEYRPRSFLHLIFEADPSAGDDLNSPELYSQSRAANGNGSE